MKVYLRPTYHGSPALARVAAALAQHAPLKVRVVADLDAADLVVLHVIGRLDRVTRDAERATRKGQRYAIVQYTLESTLRPHLRDWLPLWRGAVGVYSYLDFAGVPLQGVNAVHLPLGVAPEMDAPSGGHRSYLLMTSGASWLTESVKEATLAAQALGGRVWHLGTDLRRPGVDYVSGIPDWQLARLYGSTLAVSGLRRTEGFELPAAEGLCCGARPLLFERAHYQRWYGELADYVPEGPRRTVQAAVVEALARLRPVEEAERRAARERFSWRWIAPQVWRGWGA